MRKYQTVVIFSPALSEIQLRGEVAKVRDLLATNGATEIAIENWGKRELAFRMNKERFGTYLHFGYQSDNHGVVEELQRVLGISDGVLRYQTHNMSFKKRKVKASPLRRSQGGMFEDSGFDDRSELEY